MLAINMDDITMTHHTDWKNIMERLIELTNEQISSLRFNSIENVDEFYTCYAQMVGFGVRRYNAKRDMKGNIVQRG